MNECMTEEREKKREGSAFVTPRSPEVWVKVEEPTRGERGRERESEGERERQREEERERGREGERERERESERERAG